jgi:hypothetical protein
MQGQDTKRRRRELTLAMESLMNCGGTANSSELIWQPGGMIRGNERWQIERWTRGLYRHRRPVKLGRE